MSIILHIESSTTMCSVALSEDVQIVAHKSIREGYSHAEMLAPFVKEVLREAVKTIGDVDAVAVSMGPGSYTGLRIGVSLAKGLCFAASKPLIAVPTLEVMCLHPLVRERLNLYKDLLLCPMIDARRMEVFTAVYDVGLKPLLDVQPMILDSESFKSFLDSEAVLFFGSGAEKFKTVCAAPGAQFLDDVWPEAKDMAMLAHMRFERGEFADVAYFEPFYLKEFMATTPRASRD